MKKILALALALIMVFALAACGGGNDTPDPSGSGDNTPSNSEQQEQPSSTPDNSRYETALSETQLEMIDSFGKCEENKKIVCENDFSEFVVIEIYTWSDPEAAFDEYIKYMFFDTADNYNNTDKEYRENWDIIEENADELWISRGLEDSRFGQTGLATYEDIYNYYKHRSGGNDMVE